MSQARGRPFEPGNKLGRGRPKGSRNKTKSEAQDLLDRYTPQLMSTCIGLAAKGNPTALRLCMERISPARRDAAIRLNLPPIKTAQDLDTAAEKLTRDIGRGRITPTDGEKMMNILESRSRIKERVEMESRIEKLEESMLTGHRRRHPRAA